MYAYIYIYTYDCETIVRKAAGICIGLTLYGAGCVFIILMANFINSIATTFGYNEVGESLGSVSY